MLLLTGAPLLLLGKHQELICLYLYLHICQCFTLCILREFRREELPVQKENNSCDGCLGRWAELTCVRILLCFYIGNLRKMKLRLSWCQESKETAKPEMPIRAVLWAILSPCPKPAARPCSDTAHSSQHSLLVLFLSPAGYGNLR